MEFATFFSAFRIKEKNNNRKIHKMHHEVGESIAGKSVGLDKKQKWRNTPFSIGGYRMVNN